MNIVTILNDHQAFYGHPQVKRPVFDKLAAEGVEFEHAYCASPLCGPARRSMLTGMYPHHHGEIKNDTDHPYDCKLYLDILAENNYDLYYFGKWHAGAGTAYDHGCKGFSYPSYNNPYIQPEYHTYLKERGLAQPEIFVEQDFIFWEESNRQGRVVQQNGFWCNEHCSGLMLGPDEAHEAFFLANLAKQQIEEIAKGDRTKPFHLRVDFWGPHQPYFPTRRFADMYDENEIHLPLSFYEDVANNGKPPVYATEFNKGISENGKIIYPNPLGESVWKRVLARAYAQISLVDAAAGIIIDALDACGIGEDTLVIMMTDHGDGLACHGGHFDKGSYLAEEVLRIPLAMRCPGRISPGTKSRALVSNMDIGPTILDAAGLSYPERVDGSSLLIPAYGDGPWRDCIVSENHGHFDDNIGRAFVKGNWKYVYNGGQTSELYNLSDDPHELCNLVSKQEYQKQLEEMQQALADWAKESGDTMLLAALQEEANEGSNIKN